MIQVIEAMPWVRCASGNVLFVGCARGCFWIKEKLILVKEFLSGKSRMSLWRKIKQQRHSQAIITKLSSAAVECHGKKTETIKKTQKHLKLRLDLTNKEIKTRPFRKHPNRATCGFLQLRGNLAKPFLKWTCTPDPKWWLEKNKSLRRRSENESARETFLICQREILSPKSTSP